MSIKLGCHNRQNYSRRRVISQKKFKESSVMLKEDHDNAVLAAAKLALRKQILDLLQLVKTLVGEALEDILTPELNKLKLKLKTASEKISSIGQQLEQPRHQAFPT